MDEVIAEARAVLDGAGRRAARVEPLQGVRTGRRAARRAFRVDLEDGSRCKLRRVDDEAEARRLAGLRARLALPFLPAMEAHGAWLIETWVEGAALPPDAAEARAGELGTLLGRLHAATPPDLAGLAPTRDHRLRAEGCLERIARHGALGTRPCAALRDALRRSDPGEAPLAVTHKDFCPENLVRDAGGALHVIDNEWLGVDAPGADLGRTWSRWPMAARAWEEFLSGYAAVAPHPPAALGFWQVVMAARGTVIRLEQPPAALAVPLGRLASLVPADADG